eukprot:2546556-Prymnesium_polylepis.1
MRREIKFSSGRQSTRTLYTYQPHREMYAETRTRASARSFPRASSHSRSAASPHVSALHREAARSAPHHLAVGHLVRRLAEVDLPRRRLDRVEP